MRNSSRAWKVAWTESQCAWLCQSSLRRSSRLTVDGERTVPVQPLVRVDTQSIRSLAKRDPPGRSLKKSALSFGVCLRCVGHTFAGRESWTFEGCEHPIERDSLSGREGNRDTGRIYAVRQVHFPSIFKATYEYRDDLHWDPGYKTQFRRDFVLKNA